MYCSLTRQPDILDLSSVLPPLAAGDLVGIASAGLVGSIAVVGEGSLVVAAGSLGEDSPGEDRRNCGQEGQYRVWNRIRIDAIVLIGWRMLVR